MSWKNYIPGMGEMTTLDRVRKLEKKAGTLPVIFALFFTEALKTAIANVPIAIGNTVKFLLASIIIALIYIYEDKKEVAVEKAKDTAEKAKDKASKGGD